MRDEELDTFRGFAIIWVLFIHCIYWNGLFTSTGATIAKSYLLFEMPLLFMITGASNSLSQKKYNLADHIVRRVSRIVIPYWVYAFICVFLIQITITFLQYPGSINYTSWFLTFGVKSDLWTNIPYLTSHLWFVPVFLIVIFIIPLLSYLHKRLVSFNKYIPLVVLFLLIPFLDYFMFGNAMTYYYGKNVIFYSFWIYLGFFYERFKIRPPKKRYLILVSVLAYVFLWLAISNTTRYNVDMQLNKFPPNLAFLLMNIGNISLFLLLKKYIADIIRMLNLKGLFIKLGQNSYTVYLHQTFAFLAGSMILSVLNISLFDYDLIGVLYYLAVNIIFALLFIKMFGWVEKYKFEGFGFLSRNKNKSLNG